MKSHLLLTTIAAVVLVGCGNPESDRALFLGILNGGSSYSESGSSVAPHELDPSHPAYGMRPRDSREVPPISDVPVGESRIERAKKALASGANVNARASGAEGGGVLQGTTPLHEAVWIMEVEIVRLLIANGANVNAKNSFGETPLDGTPGKPKIAALLRKHGAKTSQELKAKGK